MNSEDVMVIDIGCEQWPRWMIWSLLKDRYWNKGRWRFERRDGEVWNNKAEAIAELQAAIAFGNAEGVEDE